MISELPESWVNLAWLAMQTLSLCSTWGYPLVIQHSYGNWAASKSVTYESW
jgi:hypothetical protein